MNILFDEERLRRLIANLNILTGLPANILDPEGRDINLFRGCLRPVQDPALHSGKRLPVLPLPRRRLRGRHAPVR